jgi:hypothetical protein
MIPRSAPKGVKPAQFARLFSSCPTTQQVITTTNRYIPNPKTLNPPVKGSEQHHLVTGIFRDSKKQAGVAAQQLSQRLQATQRLRDFEKFQPRKWKEGDVYSPHDLSWEEMEKWKKNPKVSIDAFDALGINPLHEYKVS